VIQFYYCSGSGSTKAKVTAPTVPVNYATLPPWIPPLSLMCFVTNLSVSKPNSADLSVIDDYRYRYMVSFCKLEPVQVSVLYLYTYLPSFSIGFVKDVVKVIRYRHNSLFLDISGFAKTYGQNH
jgi:hypothetical protein